MKRNAASLVLVISDTVDRVRRGGSPFAVVGLGETELAEASYRFTEEVTHGEFFKGVEARFTRGEDPSEWIDAYLSAVFAQGFVAGTRYAKETN